MGGVRQLSLALAIGLATAASTPARAVDVAGTAARLRWAAASGPVAAYSVWVIHSGIAPPSSPSLATLTNEVTVNGAIGDTFQVQVAALDARGVLGPRSPLSAPIHFVASSSPGTTPRLVLSTTRVALTVTRGRVATPVEVSISNGGGGSLRWKALGSAGWLVLSPDAQGSAPGSLGIGAAVRGLLPGVYHATVTVAPSGSAGAPQSIQVDLTVQARAHGRPGSGLEAVVPARATDAANGAGAGGAAAGASGPAGGGLSSGSSATLEVSTLGLSVTARAGENPPAFGFSVRNAGSGTLSYRISSQASWLTVSPASGTSQGEADPIRVAVASAGLRPGRYQGSVLVSAAGLPPIPVAVTLVVTGADVPTSARPYDLDGDGHADVLTRDASGAYEVTLIGDGGPIAHSALGALPPPGATLAGSGDLDGDGKADLVWSDPAAGTLQLWLMNGASPTATRALPLGGRSLLAIADFGGDGKADLLVGANGALELWTMDGLQVASITSGIQSPSGARPVAAADLGGDGRADLLLALQAASGTSYDVLASPGLGSVLPLPAPPTSFSLVSAGACGVAGGPGILWRDSAAGGFVLWTLGAQGVTRRDALGVVLPSGWELAGTGDFSGDGRTDLLVRNRGTGALVVLALDGLSLVGGFQVTDALPAGTEILNR